MHEPPNALDILYYLYASLVTLSIFKCQFFFFSSHRIIYCRPNKILVNYIQKNKSQCELPYEELLWILPKAKGIAYMIW